MSRLLSSPQVEAAPRAVAAPDPAADPFTREQIERAAAEAYARGEADGRRAAVEEARAAAREASARVAAAVEAATEAVLGEVRALREAQALADTELAAEIATLVLGHEPHDGGQAVLARCRDALAALDDRPLRLRAHPDDAELLRLGLEGEDVEVVDDAQLDLGEAVLDGRWSHADLTRAAAWARVRDALGLDDSVPSGALADDVAAAAGDGEAAAAADAEAVPDEAEEVAE